MPTSVPFPAVSSRSTARSSSALKIPQHVIDSLPAPPRGPPPALSDRSTWINSLAAWRRFKNREQFDGSEPTSDYTSEAGVSVLSDGDYTHSSTFDDEPSSLSHSSSDCEGYLAASSDAASRSEFNRQFLAAVMDRRPLTAPQMFFRGNLRHESSGESSPETLVQSIPSPASSRADLVHVSVWDADDEGGYSPDSDSITECDIMSIFEDPSSDEGLDGRWEDVCTVASDNDDMIKPAAASTVSFVSEQPASQAPPSESSAPLAIPSPVAVAGPHESIREPAHTLPTSSQNPAPTPEFKRLVGPLSNWVADYVWAHCSDGSRASSAVDSEPHSRYECYVSKIQKLIRVVSSRHRLI